MLPSEPKARPGMLLVTPELSGDSSKGFVRIKLFVSWAMSANCYDALTAEEPCKLGGGKSEIELERAHSKVNFTEVQIAWQTLN